jgi:hypothetical protein
MSRKFIPLLACFALLLAAGPPESRAFPPPDDPVVGLTVMVSIYDSTIAIRNTTPNVLLNVVVTGADGRVKFKGTFKTPEDRVYLYLDGPVLPGDRILVQHGIILEEQTVRSISQNANPAGDTIAGRVWPRLDTVRVVAEQWPLIPSPTITTALDAPCGVDGRFRVSTAPFDLKRRDSVTVYYREGRFLVYREQWVPGLTLDLEALWASQFLGPTGRPYELRLFDRTGRPKATYRQTTFSMSVFHFTTPSGRPVTVESGDGLQVVGAGGFSTRVKLVVEHPPDSDVTTVRTKPNSSVFLTMAVTDPGDGHTHLLNAGGRTDSTGLFSNDWGLVPAGTRNIKAIVEYPDGNRFSRRLLVVPGS